MKLKYGHEIDFFPWMESYDQPRQHIKKQRHYFVYKGLSSQTMVFPVVMNGCEICTIKKAEGWRIDAFKLWCWRRLLRVPWTERRSNQSILKEINPDIHWKDWCWSWKCNTLATWCEELTYWKKTLMLERLRAGEGDEEMVEWHHQLNGHELEQTLR